MIQVTSEGPQGAGGGETSRRHGRYYLSGEGEKHIPDKGESMRRDTEVRAHTHVMVSMGRQAMVMESVAGR